MDPIGLIIALLAHRFFLILIFFDSVFFLLYPVEESHLDRAICTFCCTEGLGIT